MLPTSRREVQAPPHDALVCGIDYADSCAACRAHFGPPESLPPAPHNAQFLKLLHHYAILGDGIGNAHLRHELIAPCMSSRSLAELVGSLCRAAHRDPVLAALAPDIAEIVRAVLREERAR